MPVTAIQSQAISIIFVDKTTATYVEGAHVKESSKATLNIIDYYYYYFITIIIIIIIILIGTFIFKKNPNQLKAPQD